jgi:hypothetical protein
VIAVQPPTPDQFDFTFKADQEPLSDLTQHPNRHGLQLTHNYYSQDRRKNIAFKNEILSKEAAASDFEQFRSSLVDLTPPSDLFEGDSNQK